MFAFSANWTAVLKIENHDRKSLPEWQVLGQQLPSYLRSSFSLREDLLEVSMQFCFLWFC